MNKSNNCGILFLYEFKFIIFQIRLKKNRTKSPVCNYFLISPNSISRSWRNSPAVVSSYNFG